MAIFSAGASVSLKFAPIAAKAGCVVIDNSSAFRMDKNVPLVIPEINPEALRGHKGIIANPNCTTIITLMALWPLHKNSGCAELSCPAIRQFQEQVWKPFGSLNSKLNNLCMAKP